MKITRKLVVLLLMAVILLTIAGCGDKKSDEQAQQKKISRLGYLEKSSSEQKSLDNWRKAVSWPKNYTLKISLYDSVSAMLLDLNAGKLDSIGVPNCTANYIVANDDQLINVMPDSGTLEDYCMATRDKDIALCESLDDAIDTLKSDGTMDELVKTYLENATGDPAPATQILKRIKGAPVYKVGITGDYPPFDYVSTDGTPAGFNVALLNAISKKEGINFEIVQVDAPARMTALASGKIDVVFWMGYTQSDDYKPSGDGLCLTDCYHSEATAAVAKKSASDK